MGVVSELLANVPLPRMVEVRQHFSRERIEPANLPGIVRGELMREKIRSRVHPGMRVAITCGSRGVANIALITRAIVDFVRECGGEPFVFPAMGSHGGATAEGQRDILTSYGVTEQAMGCPILCSMETVQIGRTDDGIPVYIDRFAAEADGIILCGRIKAHTGFQGPYESGLMKMATIGMGKQYGAEFCHAAGFKHMAVNMPKIANVILKSANVIAGVGLIENAYDETCRAVALTAEEIPEREPGLLLEAKAKMGRLLFSGTDVLVVDKIGKNISGDGMDPNITGRPMTPYLDSKFDAQRIVVLDLTDETHGNANGSGMADVTTRRLVNKLDTEITYPNAITCNVLEGVKIPLFVNTDREAVQLAVRTCVEIDHAQPRIIRIRDTLSLDTILISEAMLDEVRANPDLTILGEPTPWPFDESGNLW